MKMSFRDQSPEEKEAGLVCIGEIYQDTQSPGADLYVRVMTESGIIAYRFARPESFYSKILKWCTSVKKIPERD